MGWISVKDRLPDIEVSQTRRFAKGGAIKNILQFVL